MRLLTGLVEVSCSTCNGGNTANERDRPKPTGHERASDLYGLNQKQRIPILDRLGIFLEDFYNPAFKVSLNFVHEFHGFDNTESLTFFDNSTNFNVVVRIW